MAKQTATNLTSIDAIISAFVTFAAANAGFTNNGTVVIGSDTLYRLSRTTATITTHWGFRNETIVQTSRSDNGITSRMMTVLPTAANWDTVSLGQRKKSRTGFFDLIPNYPSYTFYADGTNAYAVIEVRTNLFTYLCIGNITKIGTFTGGAFLQATDDLQSVGVWEGYQQVGGNSPRNNNALFSTRGVTSAFLYANYVRHHTTGGTLDFMRFGGQDSLGDQNFGCGSLPPMAGSIGNFVSIVDVNDCQLNYWARPFHAAPSPTTLRSPIFVPYVFRQDSATLRARCIGFVENFGAVNMSSLNPKDLVNTDWRVFPLGQKSGDNTVGPVTGIYGYAFKEIP